MMKKIKCNIKKVLSILISVSILASVFTGIDFSAYAQTLTGSCGENVTYTLDTDSGLLTISGTGPMTNYSSASNVPWYNNSSSVKTVKIEYGVTRIGNGAFYNCSSLRSVTIPNSVTSIGNGAFYNCSSLANVTIPNSVTNIGQSAFYACKSLTIKTIMGSYTDYYAQQNKIYVTYFSPTYIQLISLPSVLDYYIGDMPDLSGISAYVFFENGEAKTVYSNSLYTYSRVN
ncbi:MAG: leucine-rich repeat domain-containing protein [Eubacterium sp.]